MERTLFPRTPSLNGLDPLALRDELRAYFDVPNFMKRLADIALWEKIA